MATATGHDAIVVGAGHNGLVAAAYLARAGLRVLVLEARDRVGGAAVTEELGGVRIPALAHTVGRLRPAVQRDLELARHGLALVAPEVRLFAPLADGTAITLRNELAATVEGLRERSEGDAAAFVEFDRRVRSLARFLADLGDEVPPDITAPGFGDALLGLRLGRAFRGLGRRDGREILRVLAMAVGDFVAESFRDDALRAVLAWRGVRHTAMGPRSAGTTQVLLADAAGNDGGAVGETVIARGGPSAVAEAIAEAARAAGAEIRTGAPVARVVSDGGTARGVVLATGEELAAPRIVAGIDPKRLLVGLVDPVALGPSLRWRAGNIRTTGRVAKVNLVLGGLPAFTAARGDERLLRGRILVGADALDGLERAFDASKHGRVPERPVLEATIPTLVDPSLVEGAPAGTHVVSVIAQWVPGRPADGDLDGQRAEVERAVLRTLETVAPGISGLVRARRTLVPADLEAEYGLTGGHPMHAEPGLDSFFLWRPLLGWARHRMPLEGLYLAGSGAHPGGGVTGAPGRNAATRILADRGRR